MYFCATDVRYECQLSFSDAEKLLFAKVDEIEEKYRQTGSEEVLVENADLIFKNLEVILRRITELYCFVVPMILGCDGTHEIVEYFFRLNFYNFQADLSKCLAHVRTWSDKYREEFLLDLKQNGASFFRLPRGYTDKEVNDLINSKDLGKQEEKEEK
ncbi:MAG: hypothetical protein ABSF44_11375 [Candidatus Bathyarchaeia archaeon]